MEGQANYQAYRCDDGYTDHEDVPLMPRPLLHEWMHRFELPAGLTKFQRGRVIRVWTKATATPDANEFERQHREMFAMVENRFALDELTAPVLAGLDYVSAVEEIDGLGNGRLVYVDWP
jgi:hypothetical protein